MQFIKYKKHWLLIIAIFINLFFVLLTYPLSAHAGALTDDNGTQDDTNKDIIAGESVVTGTMKHLMESKCISMYQQ